MPSLFLLASIALGQSALGQTDPYFITLTTPRNVWDVVSADVNADGHKDIVALCSDEQSDPLQKEIAVFFATEAGRYQTTPSMRLAIEAESGVAFLSEVDGNPGKEIVVTRATGAKVYRFAGKGFELYRETSFATLLPSGSKEPQFLPHASIDLDGDGVDEWLLPGLEGYEIRNVDGLIQSLTVDIGSEIRPYVNPSVRHTLPAVHPFDQAGTETKGVAFLSDSNADFAYGENWSQHKRYRIPLQIDDQWDSSARMADIDNNGFPDLIVTQSKGTVKMQVVTQVYLAEKPFEYPAKPTATFETKGALSSPYFADVDGDDRVDLVLVHIPFGVGSLINYFVRNKVSVKADVHLFNGTTFPESPDFKTSLSVDAPDGRDTLAFAMGDFNGDGRLDAAFAEKSDQLAVHVGGAGKAFVDKNPTYRFDMPAFGVARPHDLDANDRDDLIVYHPSGDARRRIEVIVF